MRGTKLGIIGGGQLGMLLVQAAIRFPVQTSVYDPNPSCSAAAYTQNFVQGSFEDYEKVLEFGLQHDAVIFEIEKTDVTALLELQKRGVRVASAPETLEWIQDKGVQKKMLKEVGIPVPSFEYVSASDVRKYNGPFPVVQKWRTGGYDGYGVAIHEGLESLKNAQEVDSIFEEKVDIAKEISVILARDTHGNVEVYPPVEMVFDPDANLVDYLIAPARIEKQQEEEMNAVARKISEKLNFIGIYAIEFFIDTAGKVYANEIAPRPHNSGHHTISANITSQYEQQIRVALGLPLGYAEQITPCVMVNLLADNTTGPTHYKGLKKAFEIPNVQYTFYGKEEVRPSRKMGHALIIEKTLEKALERMNDIRTTLTITSHE